MKDIRRELLNELKEVAPQRNIKLATNIEYLKEDNNIWIVMKKEAIGYADKPNMQKDSEAFEGWAMIIKSHYQSDVVKKIVLDVDIDEMPSPKEVFSEVFVSDGIKRGHYGRFLYRALRFYEDYDWFELSPKIMKVVKEFEKILQENVCCNHLQKAEARTNNKKEKQVEAFFSENPQELINLLGNMKEIRGNVYRQLLCWLRIKNNKIPLFTENMSALDLWNVTDNEMNIFELKAANYSKIGIISELFFYVHYCKDVFSNSAVFEMKKSEGNERGYGILQCSTVEKINGFMLVNKYHPLVTNQVVEMLNVNHSGIKYYKASEYEIGLYVKPIVM